jgi:diguanylate cyclase
VRETRAQVDGFAGLMRSMQDETRDFGRDLATHAAEMDGGPDADALVRITAAMLARVVEAEQRLEEATQETEDLRDRLQAAEQSARQDPLTGLANRRALEEAFAAADLSAPLCLALCDVDRFKRINDGFGHVVGDRVLAAIGQGLTDACPGQLVVRHGGEEFAVLIAGLSLDEATALMEDAREQVAARRFRSRDTGELIGTVTVSVGLTAVVPGEALEPVYARADRFLYTAKRTGRDRLCAG